MRASGERTQSLLSPKELHSNACAFVTEITGDTHRGDRHGTRVTIASRWCLLCDEAAVPTAILETNYDITARKRAEAERLKREERL